MQTNRLVRCLAFAIGCWLTAHPAVFAQDFRGTAEQQMACTPDVWRLCAAQIPDVERIVGCLRANTPYLSNGCRAVFAGPPPHPARRGRPARPPPGRTAQPNVDDD